MTRLKLVITFASDNISGEMKYFNKTSFCDKHSKFLLVNQSINRGVKDSISRDFLLGLSYSFTFVFIGLWMVAITFVPLEPYSTTCLCLHVRST